MTGAITSTVLSTAIGAYAGISCKILILISDNGSFTTFSNYLNNCITSLGGIVASSINSTTGIYINVVIITTDFVPVANLQNSYDCVFYYSANTTPNSNTSTSTYLNQWYNIGKGVVLG